MPTNESFIEEMNTQLTSSWLGSSPALLNPAAAAHAWLVGPVANLPRADPWPMRGENKTARELWLLDSAVARGYSIKVAEGLIEAFITVVLGKLHSCR